MLTWSVALKLSIMVLTHQRIEKAVVIVEITERSYSSSSNAIVVRYQR